MNPMLGRLCRLLLCLVLVALTRDGAAQTTVQTLKRLSLEELMRVEVSTVSRTPEATATLPAAVFVITQDDIRRSGATTLPEALRLAPGIQVAQIDAARYAIGMRGFPDRLARSMLVLMDGRAVYSPLFAGTYWEVQETLLEDVDRIEVIRGPGGTLWGANAVNGIINIVTRSAADSQGLLLSASGGPDMRGPLGVRYGWQAGSRGHARVYFRGTDRDSQARAGDDPWRLAQGGFRGDWTLAGQRRLTVQGDAYAAALGQQYPVFTDAFPYSRMAQRTAPLSGGNVLARVSGPWREGRFQLQSYLDRTVRIERPVGERRHTFDVDFQVQRRAWSRHDLVAGAGFRVTSGAITATAPSAFVPRVRTDRLYSALVQDDVALMPRLRVVGGVKVEHNAYSGIVVQPSGRFTWTMDGAQTLVGSVTRAQRIPSRVETDYTTASVSNPALPSFVRLLPNPDFQPESLVAYEAGYRVRAAGTAFLTASLFYNDLDRILSTELKPAFVEVEPAPARLILPVTFANGLQGQSHGVEVTGDVRPARWWRFTGNYSHLRIALSRKAGSTDVSQERRNEGLSPRHQVQLTSSFDLPREVSLDWFVRYASALRVGPVPAYATSNLRVTWSPTPGLEVAVVGLNLHDARHTEWNAGSAVPLRRSGYVNVTWRASAR